MSVYSGRTVLIFHKPERKVIMLQGPLVAFDLSFVHVPDDSVFSISKVGRATGSLHCVKTLRHLAPSNILCSNKKRLLRYGRLVKPIAKSAGRARDDNEPNGPPVNLGQFFNEILELQKRKMKKIKSKR